MGLAVLDIVAVAFGGAEYFLGVPRFFPFSPVTLIMYSSADVAGGFLRIPATFTSAHAFGGTMVGTIPYLIGLWTKGEKPYQRLLANPLVRQDRPRSTRDRRRDRHEDDHYAINE